VILTAGTVSAAPAEAAPAVKASGACGRTAHQRPRIRHVVVIVMENHSRSSIIGHAPFLTALAHRCGQATDYSAVAHPSLPNYLAMTSGSTHGVHSDCDPTECPIRGPSVFSQLSRHHRKWRAYDESMAEPCQLGRSGLYAPKHNPALYYTRLRGRPCTHHVVSLGSLDGGKLAHALNRRHSPAYMFVTPNLCNDMHSCPTAVGDGWLSHWVPMIVHSDAYRRGHTALFITFDEGKGASGNTVATIVVSPYTHPGTVARKHFTHYSLLRTTEHLLGIHRHLGRAASAHGLSTAFHL
jgi:phosphatidylinositol-3-phosphatase